MKILVALAAFIAVTLAGPVHFDDAQLQAIINAINSPHTDPATAALLQDQLDAILAAADTEEISVEPAIIDEYEPLYIGPAFIEEPIPDAAVVYGSSLVQVIVNVNTGQIETAVKPKPVEEFEDISTGPAIIDFDPVPVLPVPAEIGEATLPTPAVPIPENH